MKKMSKLMALLLVVMMVLMLVPVSAFAEEVVEEPTLVVLEVEGAPVDEVLNTAVETPVVEAPAVAEPAAVEPAVEAAAVVLFSKLFALNFIIISQNKRRYRIKYSAA